MSSELLIPGTVHRPKSPWSPGNWWFNPSLVEAWGKTWLITRTGRQPAMLYRLEMSAEGSRLQVKDPFPLFGASGPNLAAEDPRAIFNGRNIIIYYVGILGYAKAAVFRAELDRAGNLLHRERLSWRDGSCNARLAALAFGIDQQKNWVPFIQDGRELCIYSHDPFIVLEHSPDGMRLFHGGPSVCWNHGAIRGGAPPVWHNGRWYGWFHSSRETKTDKGELVKVYFAGCYTFDRDFHILGLTRQPVLAGDRNVYSDPWFPGCHISAVFPCGAIVRGGDWLVSYGWLDADTRIARIPLAEVDARLLPIREADA